MGEAPRLINGDYRAALAARAICRAEDLDVLLVFGTLTRDDIARHSCTHPDAADEYEQLSQRMRTDSVDFATRGAPGRAPYEPSGAGTTRVYNTDTTDQPHPEQPSRRLWAHHRIGALDTLD